MESSPELLVRIGDRPGIGKPPVHALIPDQEYLLDPPFIPHPMIPGGHLQSIMSLRARGLSLLAPTRRWVMLPDGDRLVMMDDKPASWQPGDASVMVVHGLCGCSDSPYMLRLASRFTAQGVRVFRLNLRGCGVGIGHAQKITHAGRSDDVTAAISAMAELTQSGSLSVVGVSLGGNQLLRAFGMIGRDESELPSKILTWLPRVRRIVAISPPIDLHRCSDSMGRKRMRPYNRFFIKHLLTTVSDELRSNEIIIAALRKLPQTMRELDERVTAPLAGYAGAPDYYQSTAATRVMHHVKVPTLILAANDDPIVPVTCFGHVIRSSWPQCVRLIVTNGGGHVGFIGQGDQRHWMDGLIDRWFDFDNRYIPSYKMTQGFTAR